MPYLCTCLAQKNLKPLFGLDSSFIQQALGTLGTGQLNRDRRIYVFFIGMKSTFQKPSHIS